MWATILATFNVTLLCCAWNTIAACFTTFWNKSSFALDFFLHCHVSTGSKMCNNGIQLEAQECCVTCWWKMLLMLVHLYKICKRVRQPQGFKKVQWMKTLRLQVAFIKENARLSHAWVVCFHCVRKFVFSISCSNLHRTSYNRIS